MRHYIVYDALHPMTGDMLNAILRNGRGKFAKSLRKLVFVARIKRLSVRCDIVGCIAKSHHRSASSALCLEHLDRAADPEATDACLVRLKSCPQNVFRLDVTPLLHDDAYNVVLTLVRQFRQVPVEVSIVCAAAGCEQLCRDTKAWRSQMEMAGRVERLRLCPTHAKGEPFTYFGPAHPELVKTCARSSHVMPVSQFGSSKRTCNACLASAKGTQVAKKREREVALLADEVVFHADYDGGDDDGADV